MMKIKIIAFLCASLLAAGLSAHAQIDTNGITDTNTLAAIARAEALVNSLKYQDGTINLRDGLARITLPPGFRYLNPDDAETVIVKLWHNPPPSQKPLGLLIPAGMTPLSSNAWVVTINYSEDGYVKDSDASKINYDDLLKQMKQGVSEANQERVKAGYPSMTLVGWAAPPRYDAASHKMYWAKDLKFSGTDEDTLNYSIRMLGRRGVLELNAIAGINQFQDIDQQTPQILGMIDFNDGNKYADFDPKTDKIATYGLAALVAGGIALKAGLFKVILTGLVAAGKYIVIALAAIGAWLKRMFGGGNNTRPPSA